MPESVSKSKLATFANSLSHSQVNMLCDLFVVNSQEAMAELQNMCVQRKEMLDKASLEERQQNPPRTTRR